MGVLVVLVLLVLAGWVLFTQIGARQQITVSTKHDLASARRIVSESFGVTWTRVKGRGNENFRPKLRMHAPVLSVTAVVDRDLGGVAAGHSHRDAGRVSRRHYTLATEGRKHGKLARLP